MLFYATHWLYVHLYTLVYIFMHESCLLVCRPCFNTIRLWTSDPNLYLSLTDTTFCLLSCLFTLCLLLLSCLSTPLLICLLTSCMLCLSLLSYLLVLHPFAIIYAFLPFHCSFTGFLSLPLHVHMERGHMELGSDLLGASKKGMDASLPTWIERLCSIGLGFSFSLWLCTLFNPFFPPPFLPFSLRWFVLGISCFVPFAFISRVWRFLFIFLHLYFGPCPRDVGIYFPTRCASIVHDACIYIYSCLPLSSVIDTICVT